MSIAQQLGEEKSVVYQSYQLFGMRVDAIDIPQLIALCRQRIAQRMRPAYIVFNGMHPSVEATLDAKMRKACLDATYSVPDGMPLVWLARLHGIPMARRCYGPEFLETFCKEAGPAVRHYFYGSSPEVLGKLTAKLQAKFSINIVGAFSPPFRPMTDLESTQVIRKINDAQPDIIWVGLGAPKQEIWINEHLALLEAPILAAVGAAFDFHAGTKRQAPVWMREHGLEWFFRLLTEPRRLAKRYLVYGARFGFLLMRHELPKAFKRRG